MDRIGIIAGSGKLPDLIAKNCQMIGVNCFIAALNGDLEGLEQKLYYRNFKIGQVGGILEYFKQNHVEHVVFAGGIKRPDLLSVKFDFTGGLLLAKIIKQKSLGDDALLKIVADFVENKGFKVIAATDILAGVDAYKDFSIIKPSSQDKIDITLGFKVIKKLGELDIGQAVVVEHGYVLGVEAAEGTDNLIRRCAELRKKAKGAVLIKAIKPNQDKRFDIPTIGPDTILNLIEYHYKGIAIMKNEVFILEPNETYEIANKAGLFIISV